MKIHNIERKDDFIHKGWRQNLVTELKGKGITDERVLNAIGEVPRHYFLDPIFERRAYEDKAFPIAKDQTISQPFTVAFQTQLLQVKPFDKILEVGTGSGYQSCVLAQMGARIYTIERQKTLFDLLETNTYFNQFPFLKKNYGDGFKGIKSMMPFDKILITCGAPHIPEELIEQLKIGGYMVAPIGSGDVQIMKRITRTENGYTEDDFGDFRFVPMLEGKV